MAECILMKSGVGVGSDECTAAKADVLAGKTAVTKDSNDGAAAGTMPNCGTWTSRIGVNGKAVIPAGYHNGSGYVDQAINNRGSISATLGINGTYTIPEGYHNGTGKVTQNIPTMGAQTIIPGNTAKTVSCNGKYMTGNVTVSAVSNLTAANIKKGVTVGGITGTWEGWLPENYYVFNNGNVNNLGFTQFYNDRFSVGDNILFNTNGNGKLNGCAVSVPIDLTGYKKLYVTFASSNPSGSPSLLVGIKNTMPIAGDTTSNLIKSAYLSNGGYLDIEVIKGKNCLFFGTQRSESCTYDIRVIRLEKY